MKYAYNKVSVAVYFAEAALVPGFRRIAPQQNELYCSC